MLLSNHYNCSIQIASSFKFPPDERTTTRFSCRHAECSRWITWVSRHFLYLSKYCIVFGQVLSKRVPAPCAVIIIYRFKTILWFHWHLNRHLVQFVVCVKWLSKGAEQHNSKCKPLKIALNVVNLIDLAHNPHLGSIGFIEFDLRHWFSVFRTFEIPIVFCRVRVWAQNSPPNRNKLLLIMFIVYATKTGHRDIWEFEKPVCRYNSRFGHARTKKDSRNQIQGLSSKLNGFFSKAIHICPLSLHGTRMSKPETCRSPMHVPMLFCETSLFHLSMLHKIWSTNNNICK